MNRTLVGTLRLLVLLIGFNLACGTSGAGPKRARTAADYEPRTLKQAAAMGLAEEGETNMENTLWMHGDLIPSRARVVFTGSTRAISPDRKEVIRQWAMRYAGAPEFYTKPYQTDMLFTEDGEQHWLAVRTDDLPAYREQLKSGDRVDLHMIRMGASRGSERDRWEPVYLVESFREVE